MNQNSISAVFEERSDAQQAIIDLKDEGFTATQISCNPELLDYAKDNSQSEADHRGFWEKIEDFFTGEDHKATNSVEAVGQEQYQGKVDPGKNFVSVAAPNRIAEAERILLSNDGELVRGTALAGQQSGSTEQSHPGFGKETGTQEVQKIQLLSEILKIHKEKISKGEIKVRKEVITESQNVQVPVTREELVIERTPVSEDSPAGTVVGSGDEIRVPLSEEKVRVEKKPIVREGVRVGKRKVESTETVSEQIKREELNVEGSEDIQTPKRKKSA